MYVLIVRNYAVHVNVNDRVIVWWWIDIKFDARCTHQLWNYPSLFVFLTVCAWAGRGGRWLWMTGPTDTQTEAECTVSSSRPVAALSPEVQLAHCLLSLLRFSNNCCSTLIQKAAASLHCTTNNSRGITLSQLYEAIQQERWCQRVGC